MYRLNRDKIVKTFIELAKIPSPSWHEGKISKHLRSRFKKLGATVEVFPCHSSSNLLFRFPGKPGKEGIPSILFSAHMDTVGPCEKINPQIKGKRITSDGTSILGADDKCALAMFLEAMEYIKAENLPHGPLEFLITCAEEVGLRGAKCFDTSVLKSSMGFVFDSGGDMGKIVNRAPYHSNMKITIGGKAAHAGIEPEKGVNAIAILSQIITELPMGRIDEETTANVGIISGGRATNIVAESAQCEMEIRSMDKKKMLLVEKEVREMVKRLCHEGGAKPAIERSLEYSGFSIPENAKISKLALKAIKRLGVEPEFISLGGGSDTNILNKGGLKALNLSCGMEKIHSTGEYIKIEELLRGTELVLSLIESI